MNTNKLWNTKLILELRNPKIIKSTIGGILHPRLLWNLFYPNSDIKKRHYEQFRPESALIQKFMYKNVIFLIFNFTIWYILKRTPTYAVHFKGTFTYCYHCFVHDSQIFNILQLLLIICNNS